MENEAEAQTGRGAAVVNAQSCGACEGPGSANPKQGSVLTGAEAVIASLEAEGVETVFGYPGGQVIDIYDALYDSASLTHVLARHEQGAVHEADGYARATGRVGVVLVTSGPGATNTVTGIATAYLDSIPLVVITGQVPRSMIGTDSFQESDTYGITMPVVKHSYLLKSVEDIAKTFREAFHIAKTGRPGPVVIDVPSDLMRETVEFNYPDTVNLPSYKPTYKGNSKQVKAATERIANAQKPVLYIGGGTSLSGATALALALSQLCNIPVVHTLMAKSAVPDSYELNFGMVGIHGAKYANMALGYADLIIACGARFSDRVTGDSARFAPHAEVIQIDIDPAEIGKNRSVDIPIVGDLRNVFAALIEAFERDDSRRPDTRAWVETIQAWKSRYPLYVAELEDARAQIIPELAMQSLSRTLHPERTIVVTEVGQHQMWASQFIDREKPRTFICSGGLGTMGFGFPAAIGASLGCPDKTVVCIAGDGSFQMNLQEMATAQITGVNVKVVIFDNRALGMVRQMQKLFYHQRYSFTDLADTPDFVKLADAYGWQSERVDAPEELEAAYERMMNAQGPYLLDVVIGREQMVYPMAAFGGAVSEAIGSIDVEAGAVRQNVPPMQPQESHAANCANEGDR